MLLHDRDLFCIGTEMNANVIWMTHLYYREVLRGMGGGCRGGGGGSTGVVGGGGGEAVRGWLGVGGGGGGGQYDLFIQIFEVYSLNLFITMMHLNNRICIKTCMVLLYFSCVIGTKSFKLVVMKKNTLCYILRSGLWGWLSLFVFIPLLSGEISDSMYCCWHQIRWS